MKRRKVSFTSAKVLREQVPCLLIDRTLERSGQCAGVEGWEYGRQLCLLGFSRTMNQVKVSAPDGSHAGNTFRQSLLETLTLFLAKKRTAVASFNHVLLFSLTFSVNKSSNKSQELRWSRHCLTISASEIAVAAVPEPRSAVLLLLGLRGALLSLRRKMVLWKFL